jgi:protein O-mannosyl-transferase
MKLNFSKLFHNQFFQIAVIVILTLIAYSNIFNNQFLGDDPDFIVNWSQIKTWQNIPQLLLGKVPPTHQGVYRPIRSLFYLLTQQVFGQNVFFYHLFSILIHLSCTIAVYFLIKKLFKTDLLAFFTGLLFGLHPIHTEAITFITTSFDEIGVLFLLLSFIFYLDSKKVSYYLLSIFFAFLAFFTYEMTLVLPLLLICYHFFLDKKKLKSFKIFWQIFPYLFLTGSYFFIRIFLLKIEARGDYLADNFLISLILSLKTLPIYFTKTIWPINLSVDHQIAEGVFAYNLPQYIEPLVKNWSLFDTSAIFYLILLSAFLYAIFKYRIKYSIICFGSLWFLIGLLPVMNFFPGYLVMFEKYTYLASVGFCLSLSFLLISFLKNKKFQTPTLIFLILILIFYSTLTFLRNKDWQSEISIWEKTAKQSPKNGLVFFKLGTAYQQEELTKKAQDAYQKAIGLNPQMPFAYTNLASLYLSSGNKDSALENLQKAVILNPQAKEAYYFLAQIYFEFEDFKNSTQNAQIALEIDPNYHEARVLLSNIYNYFGKMMVENGNYKLAIENFEQAVQINPQNQEAKINLERINGQ